MKKLAVMQPYCFPYLGYFQLACAADEFVFLDDVNFIKGGYINRNNILADGQAHRFALPVHDISSFRSIRDHRYLDTPRKFMDLLRHAYRRAPFFDEVQALVSRVLASPDRSVATINSLSVMATLDYVGVQRRFVASSDIDPDPRVGGEQRVIRLCEHRQASIYVNAAGGRELYDPAHFETKGIVLGFIQPRFPQYRQSVSAFVPGLSIIDVLMWNAPGQVADMLKDYSIDYPTPERRP